MAKAKCVSCIGQAVKEVILERIPDLRRDLEAIPDCPERVAVMICQPVARGRSRRTGEKRAPSAYNQFISQCMKAGNIHGREEAAGRMKTCAADWRQRRK
jgi:hypothetical protein